MTWPRLTWSDLKIRVQSILFRNRAEKDLDDEMSFHVELQARKYVSSGMDEAQALRRARLEFGGIAGVEEECRDVRGTQWVESLWQDLRYAWRGLLHSPVFALTVVSTIALGLGVNTALFTVFNAYYLRPAAVSDPRSLYEVVWVDRSGAGQDFSWSDYREFLPQNASFSDAAAFRRVDARLYGRRLSGLLVSGGFFSMLGVKPALGRTLLPSDAENPGGAAVAMLSYTTWQTQFGGAADIVGKKVFLRGQPFEVVGVAPAEFTGLGARPTDFWTPITMAAVFETGPSLFRPSSPRTLGIVGRLKPDSTTGRAEVGIGAWMRRVTASQPASEQAMSGLLVSRATRMNLNPKNVAGFTLVLAAFAVILVIACANVTNMMLARAVARQREIGVRLSLGASRGRLIRQLLTESTALVLPAALVGLALSRAIIGASVWLLVTTLPAGIAGFLARIPPLKSDLRVLCFSVAAAFLAAQLCGLAPALQATSTSLTQAARGEFAGGWRPSRVRNGLLAGQVAVCVLMLITAGVLLRGIDDLRALDPALSSRDVIQVAVQENLRSRVLDRLSRDPALVTLAAAGSAPVDRKPIAYVQASSGSLRSAAANNVSPEYLGAFDIPLLRGRNFTADEARSASPVVMVSQSAAAELWPGGEAVGKPLALLPDRNASADYRRSQTVTVIGVVRDETSRWISNGESKAILYFPANPRSAGTQLLLTVHGDAESAMHRLDADLAAIDPNAIDEMQTLQVRKWVSEEAYSFRVIYWISSALGVLALLLTLSGIYGVVSFVVSQRTKEIGIRMALGATAFSVARLVLRQSMRLAVIGGSAGCLLALGVSKILSSSLVMINTFDVVAFTSALLLVWAACAAAAYAPARRAARIEPIVTLRYD